MDAAPEPTWTYLRRVQRWWAGKDQARWSVCLVQAMHDVRCADYELPVRFSIDAEQQANLEQGDLELRSKHRF
ncbi:hypothetical protein XarbCFBP8152_15220 [Xanthomonas arboricola]|nr:hypothetical protein XarbCFBP8152_15220 [Xanthomonas arboricola]